MKLHAAYLQRELDPISSVLSLGDELLEVANLEHVAHIVLDLFGCVGKVGPAECKRTCSEPPAVDASNGWEPGAFMLNESSEQLAVPSMLGQW